MRLPLPCKTCFDTWAMEVQAKANADANAQLGWKPTDEGRVQVENPPLRLNDLRELMTATQRCTHTKKDAPTG